MLSLGRTPLANALVAAGRLNHAEPTFPLDLARCRACTLVQLTETVPPEQLFSEYVYFSSFSDTMVEHARKLATTLVAERGLNDKSFVLEVASNDGYLLSHYAKLGIPVCGVEPAGNIARAAVASGIPTVCEFFNEAVGRRFANEGRVADVIHANNVLAHVPDLNGFVAGVAAALKPDGVAIVEVPYLKEMLDRTEFDTIYHEHLCYFSITALWHLVRRHGLRIAHVERLTIHGGSIRCFITRASRADNDSQDAARLLSEEQAWGVADDMTYRRFSESVRAVTDQLRSLLRRLVAEGNRVVAYGAAAKGSTLLNYAGIGAETIAFVADRSPHKQGRFMPGVHIPICAPELLVETQPEYVLLLTWNFADEILAQQATYRHRGGRFIIPLPEVAIV